MNKILFLLPLFLCCSCLKTFQNLKSRDVIGLKFTDVDLNNYYIYKREVYSYTDLDHDIFDKTTNYTPNYTRKETQILAIENTHSLEKHILYFNYIPPYFVNGAFNLNDPLYSNFNFINLNEINSFQFGKLYVYDASAGIWDAHFTKDKTISKWQIHYDGNQATIDKITFLDKGKIITENVSTVLKNTARFNRIRAPLFNLHFANTENCDNLEGVDYTLNGNILHIDDTTHDIYFHFTPAFLRCGCEWIMYTNDRVKSKYTD